MQRRISTGKLDRPRGLAAAATRGVALRTLYLGCWFLRAGMVYYFFGLETKGKSIERIDRELAKA
ncbi:hypothetical protein KQ910_09070 [Reyranella sp. MMS21-HV4-11]|uniref:Uncharacterized protein n=1 Tax=Reyranella humidisoli TaxID=2849149 RepID=A0ABS6IH35_9HYPH|nr:hypothetical protein [Reyranella sp. MMS21-HV4-11]MBU8873914.1 hypothetical protein [Reyranella sp. MMS21-HV4-11]